MPGNLIRGILTLGIAQALTWIGGLALAILLPRYLGDVNLGKLAFALAFTSLIGLIADLGVSTYLTKEVARDPTRATVLTANALVMRVPLSLAAVALAILIVNLGGYDDLSKRIVYVLCLGMLLSAQNNVVLGSLQGLQRMKVLATCSVVTKLGYAGLAAVVLLGGGGPFEVAMTWIVSLALGLTVSLVAFFRLVRPSASLDWRLCRSIFLGGLPFFTWQAALVVYGQVDFVMLSFMTHAAVVGWYAAAYRIVMIPGFMPTILMMVIFPALSAAALHPSSFNTIARRAVHAVVLVTVPLALGIMLLPDKVIQLLGYPENFANSLLPIVLLAPHIPLVGIDVMIGTVLNTRDRQRQWAMTGVVAAVLNPLLNLPAIAYTQTHFGNGAIGAAAMTTLTEVFMMAVGLRLLPAGVFNRATLTNSLKCLLAGFIMAVAVWVSRDLPLAVTVILGGLIYGGSCLALGAVSKGDVQQLRLHLLHGQTTTGAAISSDVATT